MNIRTIIIDDEPRAREGIKIRLADYPMVEIVGESGSGFDAVHKINTLTPDLIFLDIQMPEYNGFEVLRQLKMEQPPIIVFVTAYDEFAIRAFEFHAIDYLLKPINEDRFADMMKSVIKEFQHRNIERYSTKLQSLANTYLEFFDKNFGDENAKFVTEQKKFPSRFMVKTKGVVSFIPIVDIDWIEAEGDYIYIHTAVKKYLLRETLTSIEQKLEPQKFVRIHRSTIVNIDKIKNLKITEHGDYDVFLYNENKLRLSRNYKSRFEEIAGDII